MTVSRTAKYIRMSPRKLRILAKSIIGMPVETARTQLSFSGKKAAAPLITLLKSAVADSASGQSKKELLIIKAIDIGQGPKMKRFHAVSRGMAHPYVKTMSHITVILEEKNDGKES